MHGAPNADSRAPRRQHRVGLLGRTRELARYQAPKWVLPGLSVAREALHWGTAGEEHLLSSLASASDLLPGFVTEQAQTELLRASSFSPLPRNERPSQMKDAVSVSP